MEILNSSHRKQDLKLEYHGHSHRRKIVDGKQASLSRVHHPLLGSINRFHTMEIQLKGRASMTQSGDKVLRRLNSHYLFCICSVLQE